MHISVPMCLCVCIHSFSLASQEHSGSVNFFFSPCLYLHIVVYMAPNLTWASISSGLCVPLCPTVCIPRASTVYTLCHTYSLWAVPPLYLYFTLLHSFSNQLTFHPSPTIPPLQFSFYPSIYLIKDHHESSIYITKSVWHSNNETTKVSSLLN